MESRIDIVNMGENMKKKNANISHSIQYYEISRNIFGKLELVSIMEKEHVGTN